MKKVWIAAAVLLVLLISGCAGGAGAKDLFSYKNSKIGDNSSVGAIAGLLPGSGQYEGMELKTSTEPYKAILFYETEGTAFTEEVMLHNAAAFFALVPNAGILTFVVDGRPYSAKRDVLEDWYGQNLTDLSSEEDLQALEAGHPAGAGELFMLLER